MKGLFIALFFLIGPNISAQDHTIGVFSGLNLSNVSKKEFTFDTYLKPGYTGGLQYDFTLNDRFLFGIEAIYSELGFNKKLSFLHFSGKVVEDTENTAFNYNYLGVPIKIGYVMGQKFKATPIVGLQASWLVFAGTLAPIFDEEGKWTGEKSINITSEINTFDVAGLIGLELKYGIVENIELFTSIYGKHSFTIHSTSLHFGGSDLRHYRLALQAGVKYRLKNM